MYRVIKKEHAAMIIVVSLLLYAFALTLISYTPVARSQPEALPVLLIHGYNSWPDVWYDEWLPELQDDGIRAEAVRFPIDDECGSSQSHAQQLETIVENFKAETGSDKINIVAHIHIN